MIGKKILVVGAGLSGATIARLCADNNAHVNVIEKKPFVGGNCYDQKICGVTTHMFGAHLFHTNDDEVYNFIRTFCTPIDYRHEVIASVNGTTFCIPINLSTINKFFCTNLTTEQEMKDFIKSKTIPIENPQNAEEWLLSTIGPELYETFFKQYTINQWKKDPKELPADIVKRIPLYYDSYTGYFKDKYQMVPEYGYTNMIESLLASYHISVYHQYSLNNIKFIIDTQQYDEIIWTAPIEDLCEMLGIPIEKELEYRSLQFDIRVHNKETFQDKCVVNYPMSKTFTRIIEMKHATKEVSPYTVTVTEYPAEYSETKERYYPVNTKENNERYEALVKQVKEKLSNVHLLGRLGTYKYINMDQAIRQAMNLFNELKNGKQ